MIGNPARLVASLGYCRVAAGQSLLTAVTAFVCLTYQFLRRKSGDLTLWFTLFFITNFAPKLYLTNLNEPPNASGVTRLTGRRRS
jgi:hypothetical protein